MPKRTNRTVRFSDEEWDEIISARAERAGMSRSKFIRESATGELFRSALPAMRHELREISLMTMQTRDILREVCERDQGGVSEEMERDLRAMLDRLCVLTRSVAAEMDDFGVEDLPGYLEETGRGKPLFPTPEQVEEKIARSESQSESP